MKLKNIILSEVSQAQKVKSHLFNLKQMKQYYGTQVILREGCARRGQGKGRKPNI
jgi:hypothetical protein